MGKITKRFALEECIRIWSELAKTGSNDKSSVKGVNKYESRCPCCEYSKQHGRKYCPDHYLEGKCLIKWTSNNGACLDWDSPYADWEDWKNIIKDRKKHAKETIKDRKKHAKEIVALAIDALNHLSKRGKSK